MRKKNKDRLESVVGALLLKSAKTIAVAESCTGGLVAHRLTNVSGSSKYFRMGIVAYSNSVKVALLSVPYDTLRRFGAVSKNVACAMAKGIRKLSGCDMSLGITGIAGPTGGTKKRPVGLVFISFTSNVITTTRKCSFLGSREEIKRQTADAALDLVLKNINLAGR